MIIMIKSVFTRRETRYWESLRSPVDFCVSNFRLQGSRSPSGIDDRRVFSENKYFRDKEKYRREIYIVQKKQRNDNCFLALYIREDFIKHPVFFRRGLENPEALGSNSLKVR